MPHVELVQRPHGLLRRFAWRYSRRTMGDVVDPLRAAARHSGVLVAMGSIEMAANRGWRRLEPHLRWLAIQAVSSQIGCSWCTDFGYYEGMQQGIDPRKVRDVPRWRHAEHYSEKERCVLEYAEAATRTPAEVPGQLLRRLHDHLAEEEIVELAAWVALENYRSRFNAGLGLVSEGFAARCDLGAVAG